MQYTDCVPYVKKDVKMKIEEIRKITRLSQRQFANRFGIPVGTLRNWEQGISSPPDYVFQMIFASIRRDMMLNIETMKFIKKLDRLAELSINGIVPFDEADQTTYHTKVFYDLRSEEAGKYKVVLDACIVDDPKCYHHDIISYYGSDTLEYEVRVITFEDEEPYIEVKLLYSDDIIVIENGAWYFA